MRILIFLVAGLFVSPAFAQGWERYENGRFGYSIDIPPGFEAQGESDNGDGQAFVLPGKPIELVVWGGMLLEDFSSEVSQRMGFDQDDGWIITDQVSTPGWASYSASRNGQILNQHMILLCSGDSYAAFRVNYWVSNLAEMSQRIETLVPSLRSQSC